MMEHDRAHRRSPDWALRLVVRLLVQIANGNGRNLVETQAVLKGLQDAPEYRGCRSEPWRFIQSVIPALWEEEIIDVRLGLGDEEWLRESIERTSRLDFEAFVVLRLPGFEPPFALMPSLEKHLRALYSADCRAAETRRWADAWAHRLGLVGGELRVEPRAFQLVESWRERREGGCSRSGRGVHGEP